MNVHEALDLIIVTADTDWTDGPDDLVDAAETLHRLRDALPTLDALYGAADAARVQDPQHEDLWNQVELLALALEFPNA